MKDEMDYFCNVSKDEHLAKYESIEQMLGSEFYPGNYSPTRDQAIRLIKCAALSAIRWYQLHGEKSGAISEDRYVVRAEVYGINRIITIFDTFKKEPIKLSPVIELTFLEKDHAEAFAAAMNLGQIETNKKLIQS